MPPASPAVAADPARFGSEATSHGAVAILGGFSRRGDWVVPKEFTAFMLLGGGEIDLREARFAEREVSIHVVAILGGCEITVPEDATVRVTGVGIMGAFDHTGSGNGSPDGPVITVNGLAIMGGVEVKRTPTTEAARDARRQRLDARQERLEARHERPATPGTTTTGKGATPGATANWTNARPPHPATMITTVMFWFAARPVVRKRTPRRLSNFGVDSKPNPFGMTLLF